MVETATIGTQVHLREPPVETDVRCQCGNVAGTLKGVSPKTVNRIVCYCRDCQAFAHFLNRDADVLDAHGGTEIVQMAPSQLTIERGKDEIACMRLTGKGIYRWYARCCNAPIGNTGGFNMPFVGVIHSFVRTGTDTERARLFGDAVAPVYAQFAKGDMERRRTPLGVFIRFLAVIVKGRFSGERRRSPFFDPATGAPAVTPQILSPGEHAELMARVASS